MTSMRKRGTQRQYFGSAIAAVCPSDDHRQPVLWREPRVDEQHRLPTVT